MRGALAQDNDLLADLGQVADHRRSSMPLPGPQVLLGHSMGGAIASRFIAEALAAALAAWSRPFDGLVLSSPAPAAHLSRGQRLQVAIGRVLAPSLRQGNGPAPELVSRDPVTVRAYTADPLNHDRITARLVGFILDAGDHVRARAARWSTPTLLMWAGADRCVDPAGGAAFAATAPGHVVNARPWPGVYHELFNEPERDEVIAALNAWLDEKFPRGAMPEAE